MSGHSGSPSFALISVLALVSLAALTATAFLAAARLDRVATRSIGSQTQLDISLQAGAEMARFMIDSAFQDPFLPAIVTYFRANRADDLGYLLLGKPTNDPAAPPVIRFYPVFSHAGVTNLFLDGSRIFPLTNVIVSNQGVYSSVITPLMQSMTSGFGTNALATNYVRIPLLSASGTTPNNQDWSPAVGWITLSARAHPTNTNNTPYARVAFFVQDLSGLIDAERMGGLTNRDSGTNPEEISLTNVFGTSLTKTITVQTLTNTNNRRFFLSPGLLRQSASLTNSDLRYVASGLRSSSVWSNLIPFGVAINSNRGYALAGSNPLALNPLPSVATLVSHLSTNLPVFTNRAGGMNGTNYLNAIAANIVDYADADASPTSFTITSTTTNTNSGTTNTNTSFIVGFDNSPLPTIVFDRFFLINGNSLQVSSYFQFWNCSSLTSPATTFSLVNDVQDTFYSITWTNLASTNTNKVQTDIIPGNPRLIPSPLNNLVTIPALPPGASFLGNVSSTNLVLSLPAGVSAANVAHITINGVPGQILVATNPITISNTNGFISGLMTGYERKSKNITNNQPTSTKIESSWSGGMPGLRYDWVAGIKTTFKVPPSGDPRMLLYFTNNDPSGYLSACDYDENVEWGLGFAQTKKDSFGTSPYSGSPVGWVDGTTNLVSSKFSGTTYSNSSTPTTGISAAQPVTLGKLTTNGSFTNIFELGNIFDPIQWVSVAITQPSDWVDCDIGAGTTWASNSMYGGGQTLRIGRREHSRFAFTNFGASNSIPFPAIGTAASSLLDIFCLSNGPANNGGKININTAPGPVLAALAGGISLRKENKSGNELNFNMVTAFTNGVMRFRSVYPFITPSQLSFVSGTYGTTGWTNNAVWSQNAVFCANASGGLNGVTSLNDEGREEWFAKMFGLASVTSFNFRVYVVAQLLDASGRPTSSMERRMFQIYCNYNSGGTNSTKQVGEYLY